MISAVSMRARDHAGQEHVDLGPAGGREAVAEGLGLATAEGGQAGATPLATDDAVEPSVSGAVAHEDQSHLDRSTHREARRALGEARLH